MQSIECEIEHILYPKGDEQSDWKIIKTDKGVIKGNMYWEVESGQNVALDGIWQKSKFNGSMEFAFKKAEIIVPSDPRALLHYICSRTKGIGEAIENDIWNWYRESFAKDEKLGLIMGISEETRKNWAEMLVKVEAEREQTKCMSWLISLDISYNVANKAWEKWKEMAISIIKADPYLLTLLDGVGFKTVDDKIRRQFGINDDDPRRSDACILYLMRESRGDTIMDELEVVVDAKNMGMKNVTESVDRLVDKDKLVSVSENGIGLISLRSDYRNEAYIFERFWK